jgi:RNA polymerase sigma-70 factor (ECF subfamily)
VKKNTKTVAVEFTTTDDGGESERPAPVRWLAALGRSTELKSDAVDDSAAVADIDFESLVHRYYRTLYQFAYSLTRGEADACDLTQQTFYVWATKGHQLRDPSKVKTWLFTTLHREFLRTQRRLRRHPHTELSQSESELPTISPAMVDELDAATVMQSLAQVEEPYQAPIALFYLEDYSYKEIADILEVPIGTVQSRLARGKVQLQRIIAGYSTATSEEQRG